MSVIKYKQKNVKLNIFELMNDYEQRFYANLTEEEKNRYYTNIYNSVKNGYKYTSVFDWYNDKDLTSWKDIGDALGIRHNEVKKIYDSAMEKIRKNLEFKEYVYFE